jgi:sugar/nucleoside kinase (ribokinase family)
LFRELKAAGLTISLDTNDDPADEWGSDIKNVLSLVDVFLPNAQEALQITRSKSLEEAMARLADIVPLVVVKMGSEGATASRGKERVHSPALKVQVVDSVGAGDSFDAGFLCEFVNGSDLATCLESGNLAGALSTTRPGGTEAFRDQEYRERFHRERSTLNSLIDGSRRGGRR